MHLIVVMLFVVWVDTNPVRVGFVSDSLHLEAVIHYELYDSRVRNKQCMLTILLPIIIIPLLQGRK